MIDSNYRFSIDNVRAIYTGQHEPDDETIAEAIESLYISSQLQSFVVLKWNQLELELTVGGDIAIMFSDILDMLESLLDKDEVAFRIVWPSYTFMANWYFTKTPNGSVIIVSYWTQVPKDKYSVVNLNRDNNKVEVDIGGFIREWMPLLKLILKDLIDANYSSDQLEDLDRLQSIVELIETSGY